MTSAAQIATWLAASSQNDRSPKGDLIRRGPFGELVTVRLDDVLPEGQQRLAGRAQHVAWLAGAGRPDFPAVAVLRVATGATMRDAALAAGVNPDAPLVGIMASAFAI